MRPEERTKLWLAAIASAGVAAAGLPLLFAAAHLPEPLATHWSLGGAPNGKMSRVALAALQTAIIALPAALSWPRPGRPLARPAPLLGSTAFLSCFMALTSACVVRANWDSAHWSEARLPFSWLFAAIPVSALVALGVAAISRRWGANEQSAVPPEPLELGPEERVFWASSASNGWLGALAGALALIGVVALARGALWLGCLQLVVAVIAELFTRIRVTVNGRWLTIQYGHLGWVRQRIGLNRILSATSAELVPMAHGGWGYRGSLAIFRRAAVVVRRGAALQLELSENRRFAVTVDDAATAAKLLSGLLRREGRLQAVAP